MDSLTRNRYEARARVIKALAHPTRLALVDALAQRRRCVCELAKMARADMSTVSKHLSLLKAAGIVEDRKRGLQVFYQLRCPCITNFFGCIEAVLRESARRQAALTA
jgi:ArsR family transcriptional regulator